jgi:hypothetical protein
MAKKTTVATDLVDAACRITMGFDEEGRKRQKEVGAPTGINYDGWAHFDELGTVRAVYMKEGRCTCAIALLVGGQIVEIDVRHISVSTRR